MASTKNHGEITRLGGGDRCGTRSRGKGTTAGKILALGGMLPLALCYSKRGKEDSGPVAMSTPNRPAPKASCPQGTSPVTRDADSLELEDMELHMGEEKNKTKSNPKSNDKAGSREGQEEDDTSIEKSYSRHKERPVQGRRD